MRLQDLAAGLDYSCVDVYNNDLITLKSKSLLFPVWNDFGRISPNDIKRREVYFEELLALKSFIGNDAGQFIRYCGVFLFYVAILHVS